jgi:hypothetical protein
MRSDLPEVLAAESPSPETQSLVSVYQSKPPQYRATECEKVVTEKLPPKSSAML